ncbi:MAG: hypothetical protein HYT11_01275 [Candidatus Levybacteria bacterium]|nr:hypothetical protein [Candidatus Levybacteria bacterium]
MDIAMLEKIKNSLATSERIAIAVGHALTLDEMAAALSLHLTLTDKMKKNVSIASSIEPTVELSNLVGINHVRSSLGGTSGDLVVSFPYKTGEIEKVSYTLENGFLNIVVKAGPDGLTFSEKDIRYNKGADAPHLLFIIGTPRVSDLGHLFDPEQLKDTLVVNIDNKSDNQGFGDFILVSPLSSSVSELVAHFIISLGVDIDIDIAQNLLDGIIHATENFQNPKTSHLAFEMASVLIKKGAVRTKKQPDKPHTRPDLSSLLRQSNTMRQSVPQNNPASPSPIPSRKPPADWLTPKVYQGSTKV